MSTVHIGSAGQFRTLLTSSNIVITDCEHPSLSEHISRFFINSCHLVYADWCGPCKAIAPIYEQLSTKYSKKDAITFAKVNVDQQQQIAQQYGVTA